MKTLKELWILIAFYLTGELIAFLLPSPLPGNVIGFILLITGLKTSFIKVSQIESVSGFFLNNLAILFIPGGVGILTVLGLINGNIIKILLVVFLSTIITMIATAGTILIIERIKK